MKTLKDIAGRYKELVLNNMLSGPWKPVYRTGNLYNRISSSNTSENMIRSEGGRTELVVSYSPPGATYGIWVHNGTRKMVGRPYAELAANSSDVGILVNDFVNEQVGALVDKYKGILEPKFRP